MASEQWSVDQQYQQALQHHHAGRLADAERIVRQILSRQPDHAESLHILGSIAIQVGQAAVAVELLQKVIALKPNFAGAYNDISVAFSSLGRGEQAIAACRRVITLQPNFPGAYCNLGNGLFATGQLEQAVAAYRQEISLRPGFPEAYNNLGNVLNELGRPAEALVPCRQAIALNPNYPDAYNNLGIALGDLGQWDQADVAFRKAIALRPNFPEAFNSLGNGLCELGQLQQAAVAYRQAIALRANYPGAWSNLGNAFRESGQLEEAFVAYRQAIALDPSSAEAFNNLGNALKDVGRVDEALAAYRRAVELDPHDASYLSNVVFIYCFDPAADAQRIRREAQEWDRRHGLPLGRPQAVFANRREPNRPLRIGYVSPDLRQHPVGRCMLPLLQHHDASQFEIYVYANVARPDPLTQQMQKHTKVWRSIRGLGDAEVAATISQDQIDILIDLALHTSGNRLLVFARQPAPVQASFAGYPASTGLQAIGYRISDIYLEQPSSDQAQGEKAVCLKHSFWCYDPLDCRDVPVGPLPALGNGVITFGCLNNFCKVNEPTLRLWAQVLCSVPGSRLLILTEDGSHRARTIGTLQTHGVQPGRVEFVSRRPHRDYLRLYDRIDVGLDTFPYNGHTTSLDAQWMGVPMVTLIGNSPVARAGWSQLSNLGLTELAGQTPEQFVQIASTLARDLPRLTALRGSMRSRMQASPVMDAALFARDIESAYCQMWRDWCAGGQSNQ